MDVNLVCIDAGQHFAALSQVGESFFEGCYNIGAWAWELPQFPERWYDRFAYYDEIWVATSFVASALSTISPVPVVRIPPVLVPDRRGVRERGRAACGLRPDEFTFLFVFDVHSHLARKNPIAVVDAFCRAFDPSEPVRLFLKCVNAESDPAGMAALQSAAAGWPVTISSGYWDVARLQDLMAACDGYVSLHRSEGIGLTIADAMALGKPVIATDWSGNTEFMDVSNSFPVSYDLVELEENVGPYTAGASWAEPSVEHAAELMRFVVDHPGEASARGQRASVSMCRDYSEARIAELVERRLAVIAERSSFDTFRRGVRASSAAIATSSARFDRSSNTPSPGSAVLVVSKGTGRSCSSRARGLSLQERPVSTRAFIRATVPRRSIVRVVDCRDCCPPVSRHRPVVAGLLRRIRSYLDARCERVWADRQCVLYRVRGARPGAFADEHGAGRQRHRTKPRNGGNATVLNWCRASGWASKPTTSSDKPTPAAEDGAPASFEERQRRLLPTGDGGRGQPPHRASSAMREQSLRHGASGRPRGRRSADLLLNVTGHRPSSRSCGASDAGVLVDPGYTRFWHAWAAGVRAWTVAISIHVGENIRTLCGMPGGVAWRHTPAVVLGSRAADLRVERTLHNRGELAQAIWARSARQRPSALKARIQRFIRLPGASPAFDSRWTFIPPTLRTRRCGGAGA